MGTIFAHLIGLGLAVWGGGAVVGSALESIIRPNDREAIDEFRQAGLADGGRYIGYLERLLFYLFLVAGSHAAVGVVLALKGIMRYAEIRGAEKQKVAEYVLIGTMLSLAWTVVVAATVVWWLGD